MFFREDPTLAYKSLKSSNPWTRPWFPALLALLLPTIVYLLADDWLYHQRVPGMQGKFAVLPYHLLGRNLNRILLWVSFFSRSVSVI